MSGELVGLIVYDSREFQLSGHVARWAHGVSRTFTRNAIEEAPVNKRANKSHWDAEFPPGSLKASISGEALRVGPKHYEITVSVDVPYALYVLGGTGPIVPVVARMLVLPPNFGHPKSALPIVDGQEANNFLERAYNRTAFRHPSLRSLRNAII